MDLTCFVSGHSQLPQLFKKSLNRFVAAQRPKLVYRTFSNPPCCRLENPKEDNEHQEVPQLGNGDQNSSAGSGQEMAFVGAEKLGISFTCDAQNCGERVTKSVRRRSYETGTVLIQCPRCKKHHIIADNQGLYTEMTGGRKNIEEIAKATGTSFTRVGGDTFERALSSLPSFLPFRYFTC